MNEGDTRTLSWSSMLRLCKQCQESMLQYIANNIWVYINIPAGTC